MLDCWLRHAELITVFRQNLGHTSWDSCVWSTEFFLQCFS